MSIRSAVRIGLVACVLAGAGGCTPEQARPEQSARDAPAADGRGGPGQRELRAEYALSETARRIADAIHAQREAGHLQGVAVVLADRAGIVWSEGFGFADVERGLPVTPDTVFRVGSLAKPVTALAVLQQVDRGRIDLDDPLSLYLPGFRMRTRFTDAAPITVRQLLTHHAGLPGTLTKGMWSSARFTEVRDMLRTEYPAYPPGFIHGYSNIGYTLLGHMIEAVDGRPFETVIGEDIFAPLGMTESGYTAPPDMARGYDGDTPVAPLPIRDLPALGLYTSARDLGALLGALLNKAHGLLDPDTWAEMTAVQNADVALDRNHRVGLGWQIEPRPLPGVRRLLAHGGSTLQFNAQMLLAPDHGLAVAVLSNRSGTRRLVGALARATLAAALAERFGIRAKEGTVAAIPQPILKPIPKPIQEPTPQAKPEPLRSGGYATDFGLVTIDADRGEACACLAGKSLDTIALPDGAFGFRAAPGEALRGNLAGLDRLRFTAETIEGREVLVAHLGKRTEIVGARTPPPEIPPGWQQRVGQYQVSNPDPDYPVTDVALIEEGDGLCLTYRMPRLSPHPIRVPLATVSASQAVILGIGRDRGEIVQIVNRDGGERLCFQGYEAEQVQP